MSDFRRLPPELTDAILDYLDTPALLAMLRTAKFLLYPIEKKLYRVVNLDTGSPSTQSLNDQHARFFDAICKNDRLAPYVVKLELGKCDPIEEVIRNIGPAMKKLLNLKQLGIYGNSVIIDAQLDSVVFRLINLTMSGNGYSKPIPPLLSILQAHPTIEGLVLRFESRLPRDLISTLEAERDGLTSRNSILCPKLKLLEGHDQDMRLFLPLRKIEIRTTIWTTMGTGVECIDNDELVDLWLTPALMESYKHLRILAIWPHRPKWDDKRHFLSVIAQFLTSLTHLHLMDDLGLLHSADPILLSLGQIPKLESVTFSETNFRWTRTPRNPREVAKSVGTVCPNIQEIFVQDDGKAGEEWDDEMYSRYTTGGVYDSFVDYWAACRPYTADCLHEQ